MYRWNEKPQFDYLTKKIHKLTYYAAANEQSPKNRETQNNPRNRKEHDHHDMVFSTPIRAALDEEIDHNVQILDFYSRNFSTFAIASAKMMIDEIDIWPATDSPEQALHNRVL